MAKSGCGVVTKGVQVKAGQMFRTVQKNKM